MRAVSAVVIARDTGRVVLVKRRDPPRQGEFSLPGGSVEPGEDAVAALVRELREELGLVVAHADVSAEVAHAIVRAARGEYRISVRAIELAAEPPLTAASDAIELAWSAPRDLVRAGVAVDTAAVVERAIATHAASRRRAPDPPNS